jgi:L-asparaginase/Glu-tRNA(Gln) amidotransferase subunit D
MGGPNASAIINEVALKILVVRNFRVNNGMVAPDELVNGTSVDPVINTGLVNNHKARIQLQLALATGQDVRKVFEEPLRGILYGK